MYWPPTTPQCHIWNSSGLPGKQCPQVQLQCSTRTTFLGKVLGQRGLPALTSPPTCCRHRKHTCFLQTLREHNKNCLGNYDRGSLIPHTFILWLNPCVRTSCTPHLWTSVILRWWAQIHSLPWIKTALFPLTHGHASRRGLQRETSSICIFHVPGLYLLLEEVGRLWIIGTSLLQPKVPSCRGVPVCLVRSGSIEWKGWMSQMNKPVLHSAAFLNLHPSQLSHRACLGSVAQTDLQKNFYSITTKERAFQGVPQAENTGEGGQDVTAASLCLRISPVARWNSKADIDSTCVQTAVALPQVVSGFWHYRAQLSSVVLSSIRDAVPVLNITSYRFYFLPLNLMN